MPKLASVGFYEYARLVWYGSAVCGLHDLDRVAVVREGGIVVAAYQVWMHELRADDACKRAIERGSMLSMAQYPRLQSPP